MSQECRNIYQIPREATGLTQEKAAELIDVSVESLRAYETGRRVPPGRVVVKMIEIYNSPYLALQHLKSSDEVGQAYMPNIELKDLPTAILGLLKEANNFLKCHDEIIDITADGVISEDEKERWQAVLQEMDDVVNAIMSVKFARRCRP